MPETKFVAPVVGFVVETEIDGLACVWGEIDFEIEPFGLHFFVGDELFQDDVFADANTESPIAVGVVGGADLEGGFSVGRDFETTVESAWSLEVKWVNLHGAFVAKAGKLADTAFADIFDSESRSDIVNDFLPFVGSVAFALIRVGELSA